MMAKAPKRKYPPNSDPEGQLEYRLSDPGMFITGSDENGEGKVVWDGEAEANGLEPAKTSGVPDDEDIDAEDV